MKTIMKLTFGIATCFLLSSTLATAQVAVGITSGVGTGKVDLQQVGRNTDQIIGRRITYYELGAFAKFNTSPMFYVKPMVTAGYQTGHVEHDGRQITYRSNNIAVPVMFGFTPDPNGPFSLEVGPVYSYLGDVTRNFENKGDDWDTQRHGLGVRGGCAFDFGPWILSASYEGLTYDLGTADLPGLLEPGKVVFGFAYALGQ